MPDHMDGNCGQAPVEIHRVMLQAGQPGRKRLMEESFSSMVERRHMYVDDVGSNPIMTPISLNSSETE